MSDSNNVVNVEDLEMRLLCKSLAKMLVEIEGTAQYRLMVPSTPIYAINGAALTLGDLQRARRLSLLLIAKSKK